VVSFANYRSQHGTDPRSVGAAQARTGFGGTVAPMLRLAVNGMTTSVTPIMIGLQNTAATS
jgi:levansucrase